MWRQCARLPKEFEPRRWEKIHSFAPSTKLATAKPVFFNDTLTINFHLHNCRRSGVQECWRADSANSRTRTRSIPYRESYFQTGSRHVNLQAELELNQWLTGHANWNGMTILPASSILFFALWKFNIFPPRTCVDLAPKVQVPPVVMSSWYSLRHTLK